MLDLVIAMNPLQFTSVGHSHLILWCTRRSSLSLNSLDKRFSFQDLSKNDVAAIKPWSLYIQNIVSLKISKATSKEKVIHELTLTVVMKNCDPLVFGPALAMDRYIGPSCFNLKFSSANFSPQIDSPPRPIKIESIFSRNKIQ